MLRLLRAKRIELRLIKERFYIHVIRMESKLYVHLEHNRRRALSFEAFRSNLDICINNIQIISNQITNMLFCQDLDLQTPLTHLTSSITASRRSHLTGKLWWPRTGEDAIMQSSLRTIFWLVPPIGIQDLRLLVLILMLMKMVE